MWFLLSIGTIISWVHTSTHVTAFRTNEMRTNSFEREPYKSYYGFNDGEEIKTKTKNDYSMYKLDELTDMPDMPKNLGGLVTRQDAANQLILDLQKALNPHRKKKEKKQKKNKMESLDGNLVPDLQRIVKKHKNILKASERRVIKQNPIDQERSEDDSSLKRAEAGTVRDEESMSQ